MTRSHAVRRRATSFRILLFTVANVTMTKCHYARAKKCVTCIVVKTLQNETPTKQNERETRNNTRVATHAWTLTAHVHVCTM